MEGLMALLATIVILGGGFLVVCAVFFIIAALIGLIPMGHTDHLWDLDIYKDDKKK